MLCQNFFMGKSSTSFAFWAWLNAFRMVWSRRAVQSCGMSMYHQDPSGVRNILLYAPLCNSSIHGPVVTSSFLSFCFVCFTISLPTIINCFLMLWFIFLSQRLFKGKVSDIVVLYNRLFVFKLKLFRVETALSYHAMWSDRVVETLLVYSHVEKRLQK